MKAFGSLGFSLPYVALGTSMLICIHALLAVKLDEV